MKFKIKDKKIWIGNTQKQIGETVDLDGDEDVDWSRLVPVKETKTIKTKKSTEKPDKYERGEEDDSESMESTGSDM